MPNGVVVDFVLISKDVDRISWEFNGFCTGFDRIQKDFNGI
jgi:hypothetical protein